VDKAGLDHQIGTSLTYDPEGNCTVKSLPRGAHVCRRTATILLNRTSAREMVAVARRTEPLRSVPGMRDCRSLDQGAQSELDDAEVHAIAIRGQRD